MGIFTKTFLSLTLPVLSIGVFASDADARSNYPANFDLDNYVYKANKAASPFDQCLLSWVKLVIKNQNTPPLHLLNNVKYASFMR